MIAKHSQTKQFGFPKTLERALGKPPIREDRRLIGMRAGAGSTACMFVGRDANQAGRLGAHLSCSATSSGRSIFPVVSRS